MNTEIARRFGAVTLSLAALTLPATGRAQTSPVGEAGRTEYLHYCASCHGEQARGDGPVAAALSEPVPDLTTVAARRHGDFPVGELALFIDGRAMPAAHGNRQMPVWGEVLSEEVVEGDRGDELVRGRIRMILIYLESIQR